MAYVNAEMTKAVRTALKEQMKGWKISVSKNAHGSTICLTIHQAPEGVKLEDEFTGENTNYGYMDINHYYLHNYIYEEEYRKIIRIMKEATASVGQGWYDDSDIQTDYFNTAYYYYLRIGSYEKPYLNKEAV